MADTIRTLLLLGASGDLAGRLLLPALGQLLDSRETDPGVTLVGVGSETYDEQTWRDRVTASFVAGKVSDATVAATLCSTRYERADVTDPESLKALLESCSRAPAIYFALPPAVTMAACEALRQVQLPEGTILVLEKPFGTDLEGAVALNALLVRRRLRSAMKDFKRDAEALLTDVELNATHYLI